MNNYSILQKRQTDLNNSNRVKINALIIFKPIIINLMLIIVTKIMHKFLKFLPKMQFTWDNLYMQINNINNNKIIHTNNSRIWNKLIYL